MLRKTEVGGSYPLIRLDVAYPLGDFTHKRTTIPQRDGVQRSICLW